MVNWPFRILIIARNSIFGINLKITLINRRDGVVVRASASQSVHLVFIP